MSEEIHTQVTEHVNAARDHHEEPIGEYGDGSAETFAVVFTCFALAFIFGIVIFG